MAVLITGATRGLGLATARAVRARGADVLVAGPDRERTERAAAEVGGEPVVLDLASLAGTREVAARLPALDAIACNAGVQLPGNAARMTPDGFEQTFQINFLAHLVLLDALPAVSRIVWIGSATHDPAAKLGMPAPPDDVTVERLAAGDVGEQSPGRRRYTASKLLVTAAVLALARERMTAHVSCVDPGLMLSTGLSRDYPGPVAKGMRALAPLLSRLPTSSTPERSAKIVTSLLLDDPPPAASGAVLDSRGRPGPVSTRAADPAFQDEVLRVGRSLGEVARAHKGD
jgi:NAD(P)-dependent dehydrogenase (short-subunit alcohol dehydrogenase family)